MKIHVLPGDAAAEKFGEANIDGEILICRECLVEGDLRAENLSDFWRVRANFIETAYGENAQNYEKDVAAELQKLENLRPATEVNLWFEYELFCQVNMWFCLGLLQHTEAKLYRVAPVVRAVDEIWKGFGNLSAEDLQKCFDEKTKFADEDIALGANLWLAFQNSDHQKLDRLALTESPCFPHLREVVCAAVEKDFRPQNILRTIVENGAADFKNEIFPEFARRAGVYGFGDAQVERMLREV